MSYAIVFPSHLRSEAFGISAGQGAMYGKPMISSEIGTGTSYINNHNETGLVVPPSNPQAFREAMRTLWENPIAQQQWASRPKPLPAVVHSRERAATGPSCTKRLLKKILVLCLIPIGHHPL